MAFKIPLTEHTAKVVRKNLSHYVQIHKSKYSKAEAWCRERWGERWLFTDNTSGIWSCYWAGQDQPDKFTYYFANEQDAVLFALRWA